MSFVGTVEHNNFPTQPHNILHPDGLSFTLAGDLIVHFMHDNTLGIGAVGAWAVMNVADVGVGGTLVGLRAEGAAVDPQPSRIDFVSATGDVLITTPSLGQIDLAHATITNGDHHTEYQQTASAFPYMVMAAFVLASIPTLLVFLFCQKIILRGIIIPTMK